MITGIVVALPDEISSLTKEKINKQDCIFIKNNTLVTISGAGPKNATKASQLLIKQGAKRLVSWGCAAALDGKLKPGDLVIATSLQTEGRQQFSIASLWSQYVIKHLSALQPVTGLLAESSVIVVKSSAKKNLFAESGAIALDMETIAIAKTAMKHNIPTLVIRCIADPVSMSLPHAISYALNNQGDVVLPKLLWFLLLHPMELTGLIRLGHHFNKAKNKLKLVAQQLDIIVDFK